MIPPPSATSARALPGIREEKGDDRADTEEHGDRDGPKPQSVRIKNGLIDQLLIVLE